MNGQNLALLSTAGLAGLAAARRAARGSRALDDFTLMQVAGESLLRFDHPDAFGIVDIGDPDEGEDYLAIYEFSSKHAGGGRAFLRAMRPRFQHVTALNIGEASSVRRARRTNERCAANFWLQMAREGFVDALTDDDGNPVPMPRARRTDRASSGSRAKASWASGRFLADAVAKKQRALLQRNPPKPVLAGLPSWPDLRRGLANRGYDDTADFRDHVDENEDEPSPVESAWEDVRARWESFAREVVTRDPLPVWRMLAVSRRDVRLSRVGVYWTWQPEAAEAHWAPPMDVRHDRNPVHVVLAGAVALADVDWPETLMANLLQPQEHEIQLLPEARVRVLRAYDRRGGIRVLAGVRLPAWGLADEDEE